MGIKEILDFVKVEHTLFSLPFVLIGYIHAHNQFIDELPSDSSWISIDIVWILIAAVGARGLAMTLNRIIDRDIDCLLYTSPSPRDPKTSRMPSSA